MKHTRLAALLVLASIAATTISCHAAVPAPSAGLTADDTIVTPLSTVSAAECVTLCVRLSRTMTADVTALGDVSGGWFEAYRSYAAAHGLLGGLTFDDYSAPIIRADAAVLLYTALGNAAVPASPASVPDVPQSAPYADAVYALVGAGIEKKGDFKPAEELTFAALEGWLKNIRLGGKTVTEQDNPYFIIDDITMSGKSGIQGGWTYDNKYQVGNTTGTDSYTLAPSPLGDVTATRVFEPVSDGKAGFDTAFTLSDGADGHYLYFTDENGIAFISLVIRDGAFTLETVSDSLETGIAASAGRHILSARMDLDLAEAAFYIDAVYAGEVSFGGYGTFASLVFGSEPSGRGSLRIEYVRLWKNYAVNDVFLCADAIEGHAPLGWTKNGAVTLRKILSEGGCDLFSARIDAAARTDSYAEKTFDAVSGNVIAECYVLLPDGDDGAYVSLMKEGSPVVSVTTEDSYFVGSSAKKRHFTPNVWQNVRIEADTETGKAVLKINGKVFGTVDFDADHIDGIRIGIRPQSKTTMWFDDVKVSTYVEPADYPAAPDRVNARDHYNIGVNVCNLWRNGYIGEGWDVITPFDDLTPYLGYYDEGTPEVADWECKWMAEHGIDFQHICWYAPNATFEAPIKAVTKAQIALDDGYFNGKYTDAVKFCIMWENDSCHRDPSLSDEEMMRRFKEIVWPYFMDHYFADPRIMTLDGKALFTVYKVDEMINFFGSTEKAAEAVRYMREQVKSLGFKDLVLWFCDNGSAYQPRFTNAMAVGGDAVFTYNFGREGCKGSYQLDRLNESMRQTWAPYIPTVSVGFNAVARHDERSGMITLEDYRTVCETIRDVHLPSIRTGTWRDNTLLLSTWNEFSEGTYIAPSDLYGFGYLDVVRDVFSEQGEHDDEMPTENALMRMQKLMPLHRDSIRKLQYEHEEDQPITGDVVLRYDFSKQADRDKWKAYFGIGEMRQSASSIGGTASQYDFAICPTSTVSINVKETGADYLHVRMKSNRTSWGELFFLTDTDKKWDAAKSAKFNIEVAGEYIDGYADMTTSGGWQGTITNLRFDPMQGGGAFEIELIEFIASDKGKGSGIVFDGFDMAFDFSPKYDAALDDKYITANPRKGFFSMFHTTYYFDKRGGTIRVDSADHSVLFTVGSDTAVRDGEEIDLGWTFTLRDGLPYVPIKHFASLFDYTYAESDGILRFKTVGDELSGEIENVANGYWTFADSIGVGSWVFQHSTGTVYDGALRCETTGTDPAVQISGLNFDTTKFSKVIIGVRYDIDRSSPFHQLFFCTNSATAFSEAASVRLTNTRTSTNGGFVELVFDVSQCAAWNGTLTKLRFDPFNGLGTFDIDYIKLAA